jgi:hypothetical protein
VFVHRLFEPVEVELFQGPPDVQRVGPAVIVVAVQHEPDVGTDPVADGTARRDVALGVRPERWHPGVQLDRRVPFCNERRREVGVRLRGVQPPRQIVSAHRARVRGYGLPVPAQQLAHGEVQRAAGEVPQGVVDHRQVAIGKHVRVQSLVPAERLPEPFPIEELRTDEEGGCRAHQRLVPAETVPGYSVVGPDHGQGLGRLVGRAGMTVALCVANDPCPVAKRDEIYLSNTHRDLQGRCV